MRRTATVAAGLVLAAASPAAACPVCFSASDQSIWFYQLSTMMLSLLPFGVIGAVGLVMWRLRREPTPE